jgi:hypothetical protein
LRRHRNTQINSKSISTNFAMKPTNYKNKKNEIKKTIQRMGTINSQEKSRQVIRENHKELC